MSTFTKLAIGAVELDVLQADGWQLEMQGPETALGWMCVFIRGRERKAVVLSNDMERWPDPIVPDGQMTLI